MEREILSSNLTRNSFYISLWEYNKSTVTPFLIGYQFNIMLLIGMISIDQVETQ